MRRTTIESVYAFIVRKFNFYRLYQQKRRKTASAYNVKMKLSARVAVRVIVVNKIFKRRC